MASPHRTPGSSRHAAKGCSLPSTATSCAGDLRSTCSPSRRCSKALVTRSFPSSERLAALKHRGRANGVANEVVFTGAQSDVRPYLSCADVFCLTSDVEALPVSCLEALANGLPAVVTDVGGAREVVRPGLNGLVVPPRSPEAAVAWECIPVDSDARERARQSVVGRFGIGRTAAQYIRALSLSSFVAKPLHQSWGSGR